MKAITLPAPIATLTHTPQPCPGCDPRDPRYPHPMTVRWITASRPPQSDPPWRIAIHAGAKPHYGQVGGYSHQLRGLVRWQVGHTIQIVARVPLRAIVATATVETALPIVAFSECRAAVTDPYPRHICVGGSTPLRLILSANDGADITDQLDFADWTPGRWAFPLTDVQPTSQRCPKCWGYGYEGGRRNVLSGPAKCSTCNGKGSCPPIPMRGHAGWWEVTW